MPSIELVCIDQRKPHSFSDLPFALMADCELVSHRTPRPLFQRELSRLSGWIYHFGNPECREPGYSGTYFAHELLSPESRDRERKRFFEIAPEFRPAFDKVIHTLLEDSPVNALFFYTDWQFGPRRATRGGTLTEATFHQRHSDRQLLLNACYMITP